jgi:hypothetical protein
VVFIGGMVFRSLQRDQWDWLAFVFAFLTEFRTDKLRLRLEKLFGIGAVPHALPSNPLSDTVRGGIPITGND